MVWFLQDGDTYTRRIGGKDQQGIRKKQSTLFSMEELFRYYLENIIIIRIGTGLRYLWLRFVRHRKISYRTLYEGSKLKKTTELSNFDNGQYGVFGGIRYTYKPHLEEEIIQMVVICHLYNYILHVI